MLGCTLLTILYITIGSVIAILYTEHHPKSSVNKSYALLLFWPIIFIRYAFTFFKLAFKGLKEWFE